jgi:3-oxoacyl-[acyl-carrier-protein] synthase III
VTALEAVATYLPSLSVPITDLAEQFGLTPMQLKVFKRFQGLEAIRLDPGGTLRDLLLAAATRLDALRGREHRVRYVLHARAMPVIAPYPLNPLHEVTTALGLRGAVSATVTHHACATSLLAIDVAGRLLATDGDRDALALILAGEKAFTLDAQLVPGTSVFGEASAACLVSAGGQRDRVLSYATITSGEFDGRLDLLPEVMGRYEEEYPLCLARAMLAAVEQAGLSLADISVILPHNVNAVSWKRMSRRIGFPVAGIVLDNVPVTGHAFCADAFLNYATAVQRDLLEPGRRYLMAAAGLGATFSAMVLEH